MYLSDIDMEIGVTSFEPVTIKELESLIEQMYQENINKTKIQNKFTTILIRNAYKSHTD